MVTKGIRRLRPHPNERFAATERLVDLAAVGARMRAEPQAGEAGHRQETLYKEGPLTVALFLFDRFTRLAPHRAGGAVVIHALKGRLQVAADGQTHHVYGGQVLVLAPSVKHSVVAEEESEVLLTVHLQPAHATPRDHRPTARRRAATANTSRHTPRRPARALARL